MPLWGRTAQQRKIFRLLYSKKACRGCNFTASMPPVSRIGAFGLVGFAAFSMCASARAQTFAPAQLHLSEQADKQMSAAPAGQYTFKTPEGKKETAPTITHYYPKQAV